MNLGDTFDEDLDGKRIGEQQKRVCRFMADGQWHRLREIADATNDPEASVSARIRGLDKIEGRHEARRVHGMERRGVWEYRWVRPPKQIGLFDENPPQRGDDGVDG